MLLMGEGETSVRNVRALSVQFAGTPALNEQGRGLAGDAGAK